MNTDWGLLPTLPSNKRVAVCTLLIRGSLTLAAFLLAEISCILHSIATLSIHIQNFTDIFPEILIMLIMFVFTFFFFHPLLPSFPPPPLPFPQELLKSILTSCMI